MAGRTKNPNQKLQTWIDARKLHHLSHAQVQMARELGMNPAKLGKLDNHEQEPWKRPMPQFVEELYYERFGKTAPDVVMSIEERARIEQQKKEARRATRQRRAGDTSSSPSTHPLDKTPAVPGDEARASSVTSLRATTSTSVVG
jgi:hypothetical protein